MPALRSLALVCALLCLAPAARAQPSTPEPPGACPAEGGLDYYRCRADDFVRRLPEEEPPSYYLGYGDRYVRRFSEETRPLLSPAGQAWLDEVRAALQRAMEARRARDPLGFVALEREDQRFLDFAYDTHPDAYLEAGLDQLPLRDLLIIGSTPDARDLLSERGRRQILLVLRRMVGACREDGLGGCLVTRLTRELRERRRLASERLRLRPTGWLGHWLVQRLVGSVERELEEARRPAGS
ncbi:MAG TPA: hypothetical protein DEA08_06560, partial [Planctomycetes bacterium]|nr:hypothetical protein [Planctomycetota bacterium]